jgi:hypothetical protein
MKKCVSEKAMKSHVKKDMKEIKSLAKDDKKLMSKMHHKKKK